MIVLDTIDSTNNYAMRLIDADKAQEGLTVVAREQTQGKGQRGRQWSAEPGDSLLMSIIANPDRALREQFLYNAAIATAVAGYLEELHEGWDIRIKWPNDIIINDKKAGGILLENVIRGSQWVYGVVGLGLNVLQSSFPDSLPHATSLRIQSGKRFHMEELRSELRERILANLYQPFSARQILEEYNHLLYKRGRVQRFSDDKQTWEVKVLGALSDGSLQVEKDR
ncbi:MAG: biotin--[acetyl-CoA-carboxylase] ligase, partial [Flavipsychrobacter sp.]|nr:biotin--[acetyl-CoA-carboxylase] ligase [Flavipsychrobacter sp.]